MSPFPAEADPTPSVRRPALVMTRTDHDLGDIDALAVPVAAGAEAPAELGADTAALARCGFAGRLGQTLAVPRTSGPELVAVGVGAPGDVGVTALRDLAAEFARAVPQHTRLAVRLPGPAVIEAAAAAQAIVEGVLLSRWAFSLKRDHTTSTLESLVLLVPENERDAAEQGARRGQVVAAAASLGRDLASCPGGILTAARMADVAVETADVQALTACIDWIVARIGR